ncbi:MAG: 4Fe-4S dicluster domain-containing protein [Lachnospiraceae bacterium]|nr:4Fe-4S dicluster domain-containing protein [Lachnospiraceae bacterium]
MLEYNKEKSKRFEKASYENRERVNAMDRQPPKLYNKKEECCGCTACYAVCPMDAIPMVEDEEGFLYPLIDVEKCIRCYKCLSVCAFKEMQREKGYLK